MNQDRREFLGTALMTIVAAKLGIPDPVLVSRPHLYADPDRVKCLRRPGWGGTPAPQKE
jgi:hypothetical protein